MNDSSFEAMAQEIDGLLGIDQAKHADWHADSIAVRGYEGIDARTGSISYPLVQTHGAIPKPMLDKLGIDDRLLRLSVGKLAK